MSDPRAYRQGQNRRVSRRVFLHSASVIPAALASAEIRLDSTYTTAYIAHVPLETRVAVARWEGDRLTVWTGTQVPFGVRAEVAARLGIDESDVRVIVPPTGGGFGGKHAVETAVTRKRNSLSLMYSHAAFRLAATSLERVLSHPLDLEARGRMLLGAAMGGLAIENSMLGAAHAAANPLTAHFGIVHGQAVGLMLPHVVRFNGQDPLIRHAYAELASAPEIACVSDGHDQAWQALIERLEMLLKLAEVPRSLAQCGIKRSILPVLAEEAARQWTANFNPRPLNRDDFLTLYESAF